MDFSARHQSRSFHTHALPLALHASDLESRMAVSDVLAQITTISTPMSTSGERTQIWFLLRMNPLVSIMLRLRGTRVITKATLVLSLPRVSRLVILELLFGAESTCAFLACCGIRM